MEAGIFCPELLGGGGYSVYCPGIVICKICFMCRIICWGFFYTLFSIGFLSVFKLWECQALGENYCNFPKKLDIFAIFLFFYPCTCAYILACEAWRTLPDTILTKFIKSISITKDKLITRSNIVYCFPAYYYIVKRVDVLSFCFKEPTPL